MNKNAIEIKGLNVRYGQNIALSDINLTVGEGDFLGIIGPNGGGKSTLLKAILGLIAPVGGTISIYNKPYSARKTKIGYVPQFALMDKSFPITVFEVVLTGRLCGGLIPFYRYSKTDLKAVDEILERIGIQRLAQRKISQLSGGEIQKMLIARALAHEPEILLLDEPTASVDASSRRQIFSLLDKISGAMTIIFVTHDLLAVSTHVKSLACLNTTLVYHGEPQLSENIVSNLYDCPVDLIAHGVPHRVLSRHDKGN